jgi:hypothetical protein
MKASVFERFPPFLNLMTLVLCLFTTILYSDDQYSSLFEALCSTTMLTSSACRKILTCSVVASASR